MAVRDVGDRLDAVEAVLVQMLGERFSRQLSPEHSLQAFSDHLFDIGGRTDSLQSLVEQIDRRRKFLQQNRKIR